MTSTPFFVSAVAAGFVLVGVVAYSYVHPQPEHRPSVTALLGILGFALIASPNWTSISLRGRDIELSLIREMQTRQLEALVEEDSDGAAREHGARSPRRLAPTAERPGENDEATPDRDRDEGLEEAAGARLSGALDERGKTWIHAFDRGLLELNTLSNAELLALNEYVTLQGRNSGSDARASE